MKLEAKIIALVSKHAPTKNPVTLASDLRNELAMDSFGTLMIINDIEDEFAITVDEAVFHQVHTVADIVSLLETKYHCGAGNDEAA